ncbi:MAG: phosphatase [Anaerorhabdus sp.]
MKNYIDVHTHTISSGHAYSSLQENIASAKEKGLSYYGVSDHAPMMLGGPHSYYFSNMGVIPSEIDGIRILKGIEANIHSITGEIDVDKDALRAVDYIIASMHSPCYAPSHTPQENLMAYEGACRNPRVTVIGHPDDGRFPCDYERLVECCKETGTLIEINNSSLKPGGFRSNCKEISTEILRICKEKNHPIIMNSDAHISYDVGNLNYAEELIEECGFPKELVVNYNVELIEKYFFKGKESK